MQAVRGNQAAQVSFSAPFNGGSAILVYSVIATPCCVVVNGSASPIDVGGLTNGVAYTFRVIAYNVRGVSAASAASAAITPASVPGAPTGVSATRGNGQATVAFTLGAPNGSPITSVTVTCSPSGSATGAASPLVVTGLTNGILVSKELFPV